MVLDQGALQLGIQLPSLLIFRPASFTGGMQLDVSFRQSVARLHQRTVLLCDLLDALPFPQTPSDMPFEVCF